MPRLHHAFPFLLCAVVGVFACSSKNDAPSNNNNNGNGHTPPQPPKWSADCDPIVPYHCGFPFPSNTQLVDDPAMPTGKHVEFKPDMLPTHTGVATDPAPWRDRDGFSVGGNIVTDLPYASTTGLPNENSLDLSIDATKTPTILIDTSTGELVPHIAEIDVRNKKDVSYDYWDQAFMIRPVVRLKDATRYIVAIRRVVDDKGVPLDPSPEFKNLRDGTPSKEPSIEARRDLYKDIFSQLEAKGIHKDDLQIAWDFSTASKENTTKWLIAMRDDALKTVGTDGPAYIIDKVTDDPNPHIARRIEGHLIMPNYLDNDGGPKLPHHMNLGSDGLPKQNGTYPLPFIVQIPNSLAKGDKPGPILQNGHGLLGDPAEGENGYLAVDADQNGMVTIAVPLIGFAEEDNASANNTPVTSAVSGDIGTFEQIVARQHMGVVGELVAMRMMMGKFAQDPKVQYNGHSVIDTTTHYYRGDSQGGIFGTTYMSISTDVTRGILGEPGAPYSLLLYRSEDFNPFFFIIGLQYNDSLDVNIVLGLVQMFWDRVEPIGYIPFLTQENGLPNTPAHQVLEQVAIGDHQVTPLGAHVIARAIGAKQLKPVNREIFQIPDADSGFTGCGIVEFDFGLPPAPIDDEPMTDGQDPHDAVRVLPAVVQMENEFLRNGDVKNFCDPQPCKGTF